MQPFGCHGGVEHAGLSAFALEDGIVYHTYSCYSRGLEAFRSAYQLLDRAPRGRDEDELAIRPSWIQRHDRYEQTAAAVVASPE
jgi:predicted dithiol-disulfide oxidoreductase (DUF899 family)